MSLELSTAYVESLLASEARGRAGWKRLGGGVEVIPDLLYRHTLFGGPHNQKLSMSVFLGVGGLGGALWQQEMLTLERLAGFEHPALPQLLDGGRLEGIDGDAGAAYVRTYLDGQTGDEARISRLVEADPGALLSHLWSLADALGLLHEAHISHRGLWPGALVCKPANQVNPEVEPGVQRIQLARFEMSALLANLFGTAHDDATYDQLREAYRREKERSLFYAPPERLDFVFGRENGQLGGPKGDIFSLGMIGAEWLSDDLPEQHEGPDRESIREYQVEVRRRLERQRSKLPGELIEVLRNMLDPDPRGRPTAYEAVKVFASGYADARERLKGDQPTDPYLVAYMPHQSDQTLKEWGLIQNSATTDEGANELADLIERDMRGAEVLYSPQGAIGFAKGEERKLKAATTVIVGPQVTWFCETFFSFAPSGMKELFQGIQVIKFVRQTADIAAQLGRLRETTLATTVPMVDAVPAPRADFDIATALDEGRPRWNELINRVDSSRTHTKEERDYLSSLEWYIAYQQATLEARTYAYTLERIEGERIYLRWDQETDQLRPRGPQKDLGQMAVIDSNRPSMAVFVGSVDDELDRGQVQLRSRNEGKWKRDLTYDVVEIDEPNIVVLSGRGRLAPPERGWLRLRGDGGTVSQLSRQTSALAELGQNRVLLTKLIEPTASKRIGQRWADAGAGLLGEGPEAVRAMLDHHGIFALQGPPGTGKTEVTSEAVRAFVEREEVARVLVSAQSHDALDNLAERITNKLGITVPKGSGQEPRFDRIALRIESGKTGRREDDPLAGLTRGRVADGVAKYSERRSRQWLASRSWELPQMVPVVQRWLRRAPTTKVELARRVPAAANIIFATTGASTKRNLFVDEVSEPFQWVIVEEAGRAWPTELAIPLVRGLRWTLVGDHAQIGAFARQDVLRFMDGLAHYGEDDHEIKEMYDSRDRHRRNFETFARFFEADRVNAPRHVLTQQYRMDRALSTVVGDTFYSGSGGLEAMRAREDEVLDEPHSFRGRRLVWIDTGNIPHCTPFWSNEFEADLVTEVVRAMRPEPGRRPDLSLAILTPYRAQVALLQGKLIEHRKRVFTVDGFQGREAHVVVASLVRDRVKPGGTPLGTVGHIADPGRANVLLSRARELLVVVGRFDAFAHMAGPEWSKVTQKFLLADGRLRAEQWRAG